MDIKEIMVLYESGLSQQKIADRCGVSKQTICRKMKKAGIKARSLSESSPTLIKIDEDLLKKIEPLREMGMTRQEIARSLGITEQTVRKAIPRLPRVNIRTIRNAHELTERKKQCILGTLLGDASLSSNRNTYQLAFSHCVKQEGYIRHKHSIIGGSLSKLIRNENSYSPGSTYYRVCYMNKGLLDKVAEIVFIGGEKRVNPRWVDALTMEGVAYWFMDDGSSSYAKSGNSFARFSTLSFGRDEIDLLLCKLRSYGLTPSTAKHKDGKGLNIGMPVKTAQRFFDLIEEYINPISCMHYKIKRPR